MKTRKEFFRDRNHASAFMDALQTATGLYAPGAKVSPPSTEERIKAGRNVRESIQAFVNHVAQPRISAEAQAFITSSTVPAVVTDTYDMLKDVANYDNDWELAFKRADAFIAPGNNFWEVAVMQEGSSWVAVPEGDKVNVRKVTGTLDRIYVGKFGDAFGITDEAVRFRKVGVIAGLAEDFRNGYARSRASINYGLLTSSAGATTTPVTSATDLESDILTLNSAAFSLLDGLKNTRNVSMQTEILLYVNPTAQARIMRALTEVSQGFAGSRRRVEYNVRPVFTFNSALPAAGASEAFRGIMVVPGYLNQHATLMEPTFYSDTDVLTLSMIQSGFAYWGSGCLDSNQIRLVGFQT